MLLDAIQHLGVFELVVLDDFVHTIGLFVVCLFVCLFELIDGFFFFSLNEMFKLL